MGKVGNAHPALSMPKSSELLAETITAYPFIATALAVMA